MNTWIKNFFLNGTADLTKQGMTIKRIVDLISYIVNIYQYEILKYQTMTEICEEITSLIEMKENQVYLWSGKKMLQSQEEIFDFLLNTS